MASDVVIVQDMDKKDRTIEVRFDRYFAGAELPPCDLSEAKGVISARTRRRRQTVTAISAIAGAVASFLIGLFLLVQILPILGKNETPMPEAPATKTYLLSETTASSTSFSELKDRYDVMHTLAPFSLSSNADAQYTLYSTDEKEVLLRADLRYAYDLTYFSATVWCDLTAGEYSAEDFEEYRALIPEDGTRGYRTEYMNGEYLSRACMIQDDTEFVVYMMSPSRDALDLLFNMLRK